MADQAKMRLGSYLADRKVVLLFAVMVFLVTAVPYFLGYETQNADWTFTGFVVGVEDGNSYLAKMLSGAAGHWLFRSPHSAESQQGVVAYLPYLLLGKLSAPPAQHDQLVALYQLFRAGGVILVVLASYDFIALFVSDEKLRLWALGVISLGGGGGWILVLLQEKHFLGSLPLEFISPESFGFLGILGFPHLAVARALLLWGLVLYLTKTTGWTTGLLWLLMGFFQPMIVAVGWVVIGSHLLITIIPVIVRNNLGSEVVKCKHRIMLRNSLQVVAVSCPIFIYTAYSFITDPYLKALASQLIMPSPAFGHYLIAYGLYLPIAVYGIWLAYADAADRISLLAGWLLILPLLIYAPVAPQRRLAEGIWVVIIVAVLVFFENKGGVKVSGKIYLSLAFPSSMLLMAGAVLTALTLSKPQFRPADEVAAFIFISEQVAVDGVVLSAYETGNNLPAWAPVHVVLGHGPETVHRELLEDELGFFFSDRSSTKSQIQLLNDWTVGYLFWGPIEKMTWDWDPEGEDYLSKIYDSQGYAVYKVISSP
jgi:hypothetical protein